MRVITGKYKGRRFSPPASFKARPTTDFAKENLFNVLRAEVDFEKTAALDLFAGTGSITLELLSRGCPRVVAVELEGSHCAFIASVLRQLGERNAVVARTDALRFITRCRERFGLVFADPPYTLPELPGLPDRVMASGLLAAGGLFVLEHGKSHKFDSHPCFAGQRAYGSVHFTFFRGQAASESPPPMNGLPQDPAMLLSVVNMKLRDTYPTLAALCDDLHVGERELKARLAEADFTYDEAHNRFW